MSEPILQADHDILFSYVIASTDMRYIEIGERQVIYQVQSRTGPVICAVMPNSRPGCEVNLSEILLEVALTCEGRMEGQTPVEKAGLFGVRLGRMLAVRLCQDEGTTETIQAAFDCILNSMRAKYTCEANHNRVRYQLITSPLHEAAIGMGVNRGLAGAQHALSMLCRTILRIIAPEWNLDLFSERELDSPLKSIEIYRPFDSSMVDS